jgi:hypothetical protein
VVGRFGQGERLDRVNRANQDGLTGNDQLTILIMKLLLRSWWLAATALILMPGPTPGAELVYPVKVSDNGRYFVDQKGQPVFWLGTTQWQLFREYTREEAGTILENAREK